MVGWGVKEEQEYVCGREDVNKPWPPLRGGQDWSKEQLRGGGEGVMVLWELLGERLRNLGKQDPSVNLKESKVGKEGGSLKMSPGEGTDPKGRPWP